MSKSKKDSLRKGKYSLGFLFLFLFSFASGIASSLNSVTHEKLDFKEFSFVSIDNSTTSSTDGFLFNEIEEDEDNLEPGFTLLPAFLIFESVTCLQNAQDENYHVVCLNSLSILLVAGGLRI